LLQPGRDNLIPASVELESIDLKVPYYALHGGPGKGDEIASTLFQTVDKAVAKSGLNPQEIQQAGVFIGSSSYDLRISETAYSQQLKAGEPEPLPLPYIGYHRLGDGLCERLQITADAFNINTACTSSANALLFAHNMIRQGRLNHAIVIGLERYNETTISGFYSLQLLAQQRIAPFDAARDGIILGEACSVMILGPESSTADTHLLGGETSLDPYGVTTANPDGSSIAQVIERAMKQTGTEKSDVCAIKAHGTATRLNDASEANGIMTAFAEATPPVTAIKPYVGHTLGACGVLEAALFADSIQMGEIPATPNTASADPKLGLMPILSPQAAPDGRYLLNFFGFGGSNTVLVMEKG
jgi:3-oxoacyl-[acyl-carrier-protein] synthase-1